jgi:hypothetical protein
MDSKKKIVLGPVRRNSFQNAEEVDLQFYATKKTAKNTPLWAA